MSEATGDQGVLLLPPARPTAAPSAADFAVCREWIARHSKSFYLSSLLLPTEVRRRAWALYAFCRRADDAVDEDWAGGPGGEGRQRIAALRRRLDRVYGGEAPGGPADPPDPIDRAFAHVAAEVHLPRALPERLLLGMEMDAPAEGARVRYASWEALLGYCFNVAATVGLMMTAIMGHVGGPERHGEVLLRAADLGVAMQLTNIARDVGEDARRDRVYLPEDLLRRAGSSAAEVVELTRLRAPPPPGLRRAIAELLAGAAAHYTAAERGIPLLPRPCRLAIRSSRLIYAEIGERVAARGFDSLTARAVVPRGRKLGLVFRAWLQGLRERRPALPARAEATMGPATGPADVLLRRFLHEVGLRA